MKKKVEFGRDSDASISREARIPLNSFTDVGYQRQPFGLVQEIMKQHDTERCPANLTVRLNFPKGAQVSEADVEEDESALPNMTMRASMLANHPRKQEYALMVDNSETICQIEGCTANLSCTNGYFRRNKVCQEHFKAFKVEVGNFEQRYCQQCNRFHQLAEFDEDKRNCRLTLACHNRRSHPEATSVLSNGTLVYLPGKGRQGGKSLESAISPPCEDLERTITNEESTDSENTLDDDASSGPFYKERSYHHPCVVNPLSNQIISYSECIKSEKLFSTHIKKEEALLTKPEQLFSAHVKKEEALLLEPALSASDPAAVKGFSSKSSGSKRRSIAQWGHTSMCQVEGCLFDLSNTKDYFKRRKVCERHFKAFKVKVHDVDQRFCQQCSRFHVLAEFDEGRKSCKRMLMGHNMRRRKGHSEAVSRKSSKGGQKEEDNNLKTLLPFNPVDKPATKVGFETHREKTSALTN